MSQPHLSRLFKSLASELIPNLIRVTSKESGPEDSSTLGQQATLSNQCQHDPNTVEGSLPDLSRIVQLCCESSLDSGAEGFIAFAQGMVSQGLDQEVLYLDVIPLAVRRLHDLWAEDQITFLDVTRATWVVKQFIFHSSVDFVHPDASTLAPSAHRFQALVSLPPGSQHTLAPLLLSQYLQRKGWGVIPGFEHSDQKLLEMLADQWVDLLCVSVSMSSDVAWLKSFLKRVKKASRNPDIQCLLGGPLVALQPGLLEQVGAHAVCSHIRESHSLGLQLVRVHRKVRKLNSKTAFELTFPLTPSSQSLGAEAHDSPALREASTHSTPTRGGGGAHHSTQGKEKKAKRGLKQRQSNESVHNDGRYANG